MEQEKIYVQRSYGPNQFGGFIDINEIFEVRWDNVSGGIHRYQNGYSLYGYIDYHSYQSLVKCSGKHDRGYNNMKVLIPRVSKKDPTYPAYKKLCEAAGEKPKFQSSHPCGMPPCTKRILALLSEEINTRGKLREILKSEGYQVTTIRNALRSLISQRKIICDGSPYSPKQIIKKINPQ